MVNRKIREARLRGGFTLITPRAATHCTVPPHILSLVQCWAALPCGILARDTSGCKLTRVKEKALVGAFYRHCETPIFAKVCVQLYYIGGGWQWRHCLLCGAISLDWRKWKTNGARYSIITLHPAPAQPSSKHRGKFNLEFTTCICFRVSRFTVQADIISPYPCHIAISTICYIAPHLDILIFKTGIPILILIQTSDKLCWLKL